MSAALVQGRTDAAELLHSSGETSARLMIVAMMIGPLIALLGPRAWLHWLLVRRRAIGVAAFAYAVLHLIFYIVDMQSLGDMLAEIAAPGIWTGWMALAFMLPVALTSRDAAMRMLRASWKRVQRLVYPAALLTLLHWIFVHNNMVVALAHFAPLLILHMLRLVRRRPSIVQGASS